MLEEPTLETVARVREVVSRNVRRTPLLRSEWLSALAGGEVTLKCESLQLTGSFKIRGALAAIELLSAEERGRGAVTASAGNHGLGLARAAGRVGVPCTVVVPRGCPAVKAEGVENAGARVIRSPFDGFDETQAWARERLESLGGRFVSAYDDPAVIAGNGGTVMLEILEEIGPPDVVVVPCGGGGLSTGMGLVARALSPRTRIVGVNSESSPGMWLSRREGRPHLSMPVLPTLAEGIEGGVGELTFLLSQRLLDDVVLVTETGIRRGIREMARREGLVIEGSAAAAVAAVLEGKARSGGSTCLVLTGSNIDASVLAPILDDPD